MQLVCNCAMIKDTPTALPAHCTHSRKHTVVDTVYSIAEKRRIGLCLLSLPFNTPLAFRQLPSSDLTLTTSNRDSLNYVLAPLYANTNFIKTRGT